MVAALRAATEDVDGAAPGGSARAGSALLSKVDRLATVASFTWRPANPALLVAERLGLAPSDLVVSATGGSMPQKLLAEGAQAIAEGALDVVAVVGSEAMYSRGLTRRDPATPHTSWTEQDPRTTPAPRAFGSERPPLSDLEMARGVRLPVEIYPLFENALRSREGWTLAEHRARLGDLWASFSSVAAENPYAWIREVHGADEIITPTASNRMIAEPYTKLMVANLPVDMGAAFLLCSLEAARAAGVEGDRMVFPLSHAHGDDHFFISDRPELDRSVAIERAGSTALGAAGVGIDEVAHIDLYSCFPIAVEMGAAALGLSVDDRSRPLTVTGGLTFGGGPGNNYVSHSIASMATRLRANPGDIGLVTGLSYFASSHAVGLYSTQPPSTPFRVLDVQDEVDATPTQAVNPEMTGAVTVETYTIAWSRDQGPVSATLALRDAAGVRSWGFITDETVLSSIAGSEVCGRSATLMSSGTVVLDD